MKNFDIPANFLSYLDTGKLSITCNDSPTINFYVDGSTKVIDIIDIPIELTKMPGLLKQLSEAKDLAKDFAEKGFITTSTDNLIKGVFPSPRLTILVLSFTGSRLR